jgi:hypothetical protein
MSPDKLPSMGVNIGARQPVFIKKNELLTSIPRPESS